MPSVARDLGGVSRDSLPLRTPRGRAGVFRKHHRRDAFRRPHLIDQPHEQIGKSLALRDWHSVQRFDQALLRERRRFLQNGSAALRQIEDQPPPVARVSIP